MQFIRGICNITPSSQGCVLTLGNFDGIHCGHQQIVQLVREQSIKLKLPSAVVFFEPQPLEFFAHTKSPARLTTLHEKYQFMNKLGIDYLYCLRFSQELANLTAQEFIQQILIEKFNVKHLIIGDDFHFGRGRGGSFDLLSTFSKSTNLFTVQQAPSFYINKQRVSSTLIRKALSADHLEDAELMLGRPYSITGKVIHGQQIGRTLGFPTANIDLKRIIAPVSGVYVVSAQIQQTTYYGIANVGTRPTVNGKIPRLEVFLFNFTGDLYGQRLTVLILKKIRPERKFVDLEHLKSQIVQDKITALDYIKLHQQP